MFQLLLAITYLISRLFGGPSHMIDSVHTKLGSIGKHNNRRLSCLTFRLFKRVSGRNVGSMRTGQVSRYPGWVGAGM